MSNHEKSGIPRIETLLKYCEALGCEPAELLSESFDPENYTLIAEITSFYPWNLAYAVINDKEKVYNVYVPALEKSIAELTDREQKVIEMRFEHGMTYEQCGYRFGVTRERIRQVELKALRKLRNPRYAKHYLLDTLNKTFEIDVERARLERRVFELEKQLSEYENVPKTEIKEMPLIDIADMELSVRGYNCLKRAGINYVNDLEEMTIERLKKVRNLGWKSIQEVVRKAKEFGIEIPESEGDTDEH